MGSTLQFAERQTGGLGSVLASFRSDRGPGSTLRNFSRRYRRHLRGLEKRTQPPRNTSRAARGHRLELALFVLLSLGQACDGCIASDSLSTTERRLLVSSAGIRAYSLQHLLRPPEPRPLTPPLITGHGGLATSSRAKGKTG